MNKNAIQRLRELPAVFSLSMIAARLDGSKEKAAIYAKRWKDAQFIEPAGPRLGVYFNLIGAPSAPRDHAFDALRMVFPEAVLCGETVLHDAGWTTQIPRATQVAVLDRRTIPEIYGFDLHRRPVSWFSGFQEEIDRTSFPRLTPEGAMVDSWKYHGYKNMPTWRPDIDDLEEDEIRWDHLKDLFSKHDTPWPATYPGASPITGRPRFRPG